MNYLRLKRQIVPSQHGFVPNNACIRNLLIRHNNLHKT